jgi:thiosulfate dehydrogenase
LKAISSSLFSVVIVAIASFGACAQAGSVKFRVPEVASIPDGAAGDAIRRGRALLVDTRRQLPDHVGNGLNCTNCHLNAGTVPFASPLMGLIGAFPEYRPRSGKVISLQERINDCFERSMNGSALRFDSAEMNAILAYLRWLSIGVPTGSEVAGRGFEKINPALHANRDHGAQVFATKCAVCHGLDGQGMPGPEGGYVNPPLWGADSFNLGAGMARTSTAAGFVRHNMPLGLAGTLSQQDSVDVAAYFTQQPRPDFPARINDWPKGGKPADAR